MRYHNHREKNKRYMRMPTIRSSINLNIDPVTNVLKWILLMVAITCFIVVIAGAIQTYQQAPPLPQKFMTTDGAGIDTFSSG